MSEVAVYFEFSEYEDPKLIEEFKSILSYDFEIIGKNFALSKEGVSSIYLLVKLDGEIPMKFKNRLEKLFIMRVPEFTKFKEI